jgi:hypothetical protein
MMVVLLGASDTDFSVRPEQITQLARLGVSNLALVRDSDTVGIVLEGWLFDPARSGAAAVSELAAGGRALHPVLHMGVSAAAVRNGPEASARKKEEIGCRTTCS